MKYIDLIENEYENHPLPTTHEEGFLFLRSKFDSLLYALDQYTAKIRTLHTSSNGTDYYLNILREKHSKILTKLCEFREYAVNQPGGKIQVKGRRGFINPYFIDIYNNYVGRENPFRHVQWVTINNVLKINKLELMKLTYGSNDISQNDEPNFVSIGANGRFIWRMYNYLDTHMQTIYIDNHKYSYGANVNLRDTQIQMIIGGLKK